MKCIYLAKPDQTYKEHVNLAYNAWKAVVRAKGDLIRKVGEDYGFSEERFLKSSLLTVVLHDIGKNIRPFQEMMRAAGSSQTFDRKKNYRHELVSYPYVFLGSRALDIKEALCVDTTHRLIRQL